MQQVDFPKMMNTKFALLRKMYKQGGDKVFESDGFKTFFAKAEFWLRPYALFCYFRDFFGTANPDDWGALGTGNPKPETFNPNPQPQTPNPEPLTQRSAQARCRRRSLWR